MIPRLRQAVLLVGGLGTRLKSETGDRPKAMIEVAGAPFLERVLIHLRNFQVDSVVLAASYGRQSIESYFADGAALKISIQYSCETERLGTAGALRQALPLIEAEQVLVLNGDSFLDINYPEMFSFHLERRNLLTLAAVHQADCRDFGRVEVVNGGVRSFAEKNHKDGMPGYINAGAYIFDRSLIKSIPPGIVQSLETETFPSILSGGDTIGAYCVDRYFADLGTPERLQRFRRDFSLGLVPLPNGESGT